MKRGVKAVPLRKAAKKLIFYCPTTKRGGWVKAGPRREAAKKLGYKWHIHITYIYYLIIAIVISHVKLSLDL